MIPPSVLSFSLIRVDVALSVCSGQTLRSRWYSIRKSHLGICFSYPQASGANFQKGLDQVAGMWTIIQHTGHSCPRKSTCTLNTEINSSGAYLYHCSKVFYDSHILLITTQSPHFLALHSRYHRDKEGPHQEKNSVLNRPSLFPSSSWPSRLYLASNLSSCTPAAVLMFVTGFFFSFHMKIIWGNSSYFLAAFIRLMESLLLPCRWSGRATTTCDRRGRKTRSCIISKECNCRGNRESPLFIHSSRLVSSSLISTPLFLLSSRLLSSHIHSSSSCLVSSHPPLLSSRLVSSSLLFSSLLSSHLISSPLLSSSSCLVSFSLISSPLSLFSSPLLSSPLLSSPLLSSPLLSSRLVSSPLLSSRLVSSPLLSSPLLSSPLLSPPLLSSPLLSSPLASPPLLSSPLLSSPLASSPLLSSPLVSPPLLSSPLLSSPLASPPLLSFPLSSSPLLSSPLLHWGFVIRLSSCSKVCDTFKCRWLKWFVSWFRCQCLLDFDEVDVTVLWLRR